MSIVGNNAYTTAEVGGRKLVRLSNGRLIAAGQSSDSGNTHVFVFKSTDNGATWSNLNNLLSNNSNGGATPKMEFAVAAMGTKFAVVAAPEYNNMVEIEVFTENGVNVVNKTTIHSHGAQTAGTKFAGISLAVDTANVNVLHVVWSYKAANSYNIYYTKSTNGGDNWSAVEQLTTLNTAGKDAVNPTINLINGIPYITFETKTYSFNGTSWNSITGGSIALIKGDSSLGANTLIKAGWTYKTVYSQATYAQSKPSAVVDKDGVIHVAWQGNLGASSYDHILYSSSNDGGVSWTSAIDLMPSDTQNQFSPSITVDSGNKVAVLFYGRDLNISATYSQIRQVTKTLSGWSSTSTLTNVTTHTAYNAATLYDPTFAVHFGAMPPTIYQTATNVQFIGTSTINQAPTLTLNTTNNQTLYENDTFNITGTASDTDNGNTVTVRYQINATTARAIKAFLSDGTTLESFSKSLTFKGGNLYDGTTLIAENLSDGVAHTLKVWATDDQSGTSVIKEVPFYVVPNRAPLLTVDSPVIDGLINSDKFAINGTFEDSDGNTTTVAYRINGSSSVQIAEGVSGPFEFEVSFGQLIIGENQIVIEAVDSYGAKVSKTVKLNKSTVETPLLKSTARYKINPPAGTAKAVLLWLQRDTDLNIEISLSMTMIGEAESFVPVVASNTAPIDNEILEDEFYYEVDVAKDNIIVQIDMTRSSVEVSDKIHLISGVLE